MRILELYNMDVYDDGGAYLGEVRDAIVDLEQGNVSRLLLDEWRNSSREEVKKVLQLKSILFKNVKNIGDVVLVSKIGQNQRAQESAASPEVSDLATR